VVGGGEWLVVESSWWLAEEFPTCFKFYGSTINLALRIEVTVRKERDGHQSSPEGDRHLLLVFVTWLTLFFLDIKTIVSRLFIVKSWSNQWTDGFLR